jgi:hypothetical protein
VKDDKVPAAEPKPRFGQEERGATSPIGGDDERRDGEHIRVPGWVGLSGLLLIAAVAAVKPLIWPTDAAVGAAAKAGDGYWSKIIPLFFGELGVALLVAYIIGTAIDVQTRRKEARNRLREKEDLKRRREAEQLEALDREQKMVQDVFRGVLGIRHSTAYVRKVIETTLEKRVVRRMVSLIYTLRRLDEAERGRIEDADRFMILDQAVSFELQNLSTEETEVDVCLVVPIRQGKNLHDESKLQAVSIGGKALRPDQIVETGSGGDSKCYSWKHTIPGSGRLPVSFKQRLIKEESDTEVWCATYACTEGLTLQVVAPGDLHMGIRNNTASRDRVETDPSDNGVGVWKIDGPILPNDSVVFYWRTPVDEGSTGRGTVPPREAALGRGLPKELDKEHTGATDD